MTSQITKDFQVKSKLRKLADGGAVNPSVLGKGAAARAGGWLSGRGRQIDEAVGAREKAAGLADGGGLVDRVRNFINPPDDRTDTDIAAGVPKPGSPEENKELARRVTQQPGMFPTYNRSRLRADMNAEHQQRKKGAGLATGLADGGSYLDDGYNANRYQQSQLKDGGRVKGPGGRTDDKVGPVMLSDEEYVLPGDTADAIGRDKLDAIRLATHEFKDDRKESALRGRADDVPVDHLADGGNPWIVDSNGNVRPGGQQPRLPPPQPGTAVGPARVPPMGQRPPINMGMVEDVTPRPAQIANNPTVPTAAKTAQPWTGAAPTNPNVGPNGSAEAKAFYKTGADSAAQAASEAAKAPNTTKGLLKSALRPTNSALLKGTAGIGAGLAAKDMYDNGVNLTNSGDMLASGASLLGPVGATAAASWGVGRAIGSSLSEDTNDTIGGVINQGVRSIGGLFGQDWGVDDSALLEQKANARLAEANRAKTNVAASPVAAATSALRSDQGPAQPVTPGSYQSRRLSEMGVPLDVQNSKPVVDSVTGNTRDFLRTGGTDQYQNLGTYGGNGNIYGKADDPSRPGRINNFVGVGAGASPSNEASGGDGVSSAITSALRGLGNGPSSPGGSGNSGPVDNSAAINARYDKLAKELSGMYGPKGQGNLARRMLELEQSRSGALDADARNITSRNNASLQSSTLRDNAQLNARTNMLDTLGRMEQNRATVSSQTQAAQLKALQDAQKIARDERDTSDNRAVRGVGQLDGFIAQQYGEKSPEGAEFARAFRATNPEFMTMPDGDRASLLAQFKEQWDAQSAIRKRAAALGRPVGIGLAEVDGTPSEVHIGDWWNNRATFDDWMESNNIFGENDRTAVRIPAGDGINMLVSERDLTTRPDGSKRAEVISRLRNKGGE